ncbi:MAG: 7TM diverse intracellular signaling domain-containing protein, partial [Flavobacteriales bacterium]
MDDPTLRIDTLSKKEFPGVCWFRSEFTVDSSLLNRSLSLCIYQTGASEVYVSGELKVKHGVVSPVPSKEEVNLGIFRPATLQFSNPGPHDIAIKYSDSRAREFWKSYNREESLLKALIFSTKDFMYVYNYFFLKILPVISLILGIGATIFLIHLLLFFFYRKERSNLYYSLYIGFSSLILLILFLMVLSRDPHIIKVTEYYLSAFLPFITPALLGVFYSVFNKKVSKFGIGIFILTFITGIIYFFTIRGYAILFGVVFILSVIDILRVIIIAFIKRKPGTKIFGLTFLAVFVIIMFFTTGISGFFEENWIVLTSKATSSFFLSFFVGIPVSMSVHLAWSFAATNRSLSNKLTEVKELNEKNIQKEREKQEMIRNRKEELEIEVEKRTKEVVKQKEEIEEKNKEITDSINYAKRIQDAVIPPESTFKHLFKDSFILFRPQSIVSGDFDWVEELGEEVMFAVCDCTGHGVPGAFMSMVSEQLLTKTVKEKGITEPGRIFEEVRKDLVASLSKEDANDGMDAVLCSLNKKSNRLKVSCANNPLYILRDGIGDNV